MKSKMISLLAALALAGAGLVGGATPAVAAGQPSPAGQAAPVTGKPLPQLESAPLRDARGAKNLIKGSPERVGRVSTKVVQPACGTPTPGCFMYAGKDSNGYTSDGAFVDLQVNNPFRWSTEGGHTLAEIAVRSTDGAQTVEVGWTKDGSQNPALFAGSWTNNTFNGYNGTGGFINAVGCSPCVGASISGAVGTSKTFAIQHFGAPTNAWWAAYDGNWIGAWPDSLWTSPTFVGSTWSQVFGEIATSVTSTPCGDMGNGVKTSGTGATASNYGLVNGSVTGAWNGTIQTNGTYYDVANASSTSMEYGGPGYNSIGTALGVTGSCAPATGMAPGTALVCASTFCANGEVCPDGGTTGCNTSISWAAAAFPAVCTTINGGAGVTFNQGHNSSTTGKEWLVFRTSACSGSSMLMDSNGTGTWNVVMPTGWDGTAVHAYKRVA